MFDNKFFRFNIKEQLSTEEENKSQYIIGLVDTLKDQEQSLIFSHLYENLSILDSKSATLLQFNSVLIAIFTIFITSQILLIPYFIGVLGVLTTLVSCNLLLQVVWVYWSTSETMSSTEVHALKLLEVRDERTILYRKSWNCSKLSLLCLVIMFLMIVCHRLFFIS